MNKFDMKLDPESKRKLCLEAFFANHEPLGLDSSIQIESAHIPKGSLVNQKFSYSSSTGSGHLTPSNFEEGQRLLLLQLCKKLGGDDCPVFDCCFIDCFQAANCPAVDLTTGVTLKDLDTATQKSCLLAFAVKEKRDCRKCGDEEGYDFWEHVFSGILLSFRKPI